MEKTKAIDFERLGLRDALDLAVLVEEEAKDRYEELADQLHIHHNAEVERFFRFMHDVEAKHEAELSLRRKKLFPDEPRVVRREMLFDVEAPDYDEARATMSVRDALGAALRAEQKAAAFFAGAARGMIDAGARRLFEDLHEEEKEHERLVRIQIDRLPPDDGGPMSGEDVGDEPVAM